ncbi:hypothetical protein [Fodinicola feengrottensis]|uniref:hypothetical protein n=1 Tax=Fodinicola feengrottensis TaxID=435914 RepID=UPI0024431AE3|nr:hypothetical protein [Fodinicola feengrottensis]
MVFYQHDEVMAHAPKDVADQVVTAIGEAAATATRLLFGAHPGPLPGRRRRGRLLCRRRPRHPAGLTPTRKCRPRIPACRLGATISGRMF